VLALVPGDQRASESAIGSATGTAEVRVANADEVMFATGFAPGGVAPFPVRAVTRTLIDSSFVQHQVVWMGAGTSTYMAAISPHELQRLTNAAAVDMVTP